MQNPEIYHPDFLSGPVDGDMSLATVLDRKSSWCYFNNCNNNIYNKDKNVTEDDMASFNLMKNLFLWIFCILLSWNINLKIFWIE